MWNPGVEDLSLTQYHKAAETIYGSFDTKNGFLIFKLAKKIAKNWYDLVTSYSIVSSINDFLYEILSIILRTIWSITILSSYALILIILENNEPSDNVKTIDFLTHEHNTDLIEDTL